ncbi:sensor histidine kinase [Bifidobacterium aesculapii]|uniref:sensor histidine kinase n=1 Tax=Bifidobacterium aesculapii TaxID=1329411 RepID=UPI0006E3894F|nr:histidine kinase [Bifidobacterium aesculapii]
MRVMGEKALLAALGVALALCAHAPVDAVLVAALLAATSVTGLVSWMRPASLAWLSTAAFVTVAVFVPLWRVFLPLAAYDQARMGLPRVRWRSAVALRLMPLSRWLWLLPFAPLFASLVAGDGGTGAADGLSDPALASALVIVSCVGCALGFESRDAATTHDEVLRLRDGLREHARVTRMRMADVAEERARSVRMATLGERTRIAREIHDNVGHLLTRAIMQSQASRTVAEATGDTVAAQGFGAIASTLDGAMTMVRRSVHDLEDDGTDFAAQIEDAARSFDGISRDFHVSVTNDIADAPAPVARCFATAIREALANVVHHSEAREATVTLRDMPALWQLVVQDPGPAAAGAGGAGRGMGVADIESRARALGGTALCGPYAAGWRVFVSLPKSRWTTREGSTS